MSRLLELPTGRRLKFLVILAWAAIAFFGISLADDFEQAQQNDPVSFLPEDTESVRALQAVQRIQDGQQTPAVVVAYREGGLTQADRRALRELRASLRSDPVPNAQGASQLRFAPDGTAATLSVPIDVGGGSSEALARAVEQLRQRVDDLDGSSGGLQVKVGGPAGIAADLQDAFGGINGTLLMVTAGLVFVLLILIYRSPIFWIVPLAAVGAAEVTSRGVGYLLTQIGVTVNGQSAGILLVLVFGAGTDYALLLVARYREELRRHEDPHDAMRAALRRAGPTVLASALTVIAALLVLLVARVNATAGMGPVGAVGVAVAMVSMLTLLPALLATVGRRAFWPFIPRHGDEGGDPAEEGFWRGLGERLARRPRPVWLTGAAVLVVLCAGMLKLDLGLTQGEQFRSEPPSLRAQELLSRAFPAGTTAPVTVVVPPGTDAQEVRRVLRRSPAIASVLPQTQQGDAGTIVRAALSADPYSDRALDAIEDLRRSLSQAGVGEALVGGQTAQERDYRAAALRDDLVVPPLVVLAVLAILAVVLRAVVLPFLLMASVVLSFGAALGVGVLAFDWIFGYPGIEPTLPVIAFIFLVALGTDYNIFLLARAREETEREGTHEGMIRALGATGAVITSAGIVLAGTFATLMVLPLVVLTEIGFVIAFGVLLDTFLVRSIIVPSLVHDVGHRVWWPWHPDRTR